MLHSIRVFLISIIVSTMALADVFMTELTDAQDASSAGKYVELYNNGDSDVDLSAGWTVQRWTNGNADPTASSIKSLTGTITAGGFYLICNDADKISTTYGITCDQDIGTGGFSDSNGDDNMALLLDGAIVDIFGVPGEDGSGTSHEFEDGRAERASDCTTAQATYSDECWNTWCDSNNACDINDNQEADEGFDPGAWIGATSGGDDGGATTCDDDTACNNGATGDCEYVNVGWGNLQWPYSTTVDAGSDSENIYGHVWVDGVTGSGTGTDNGVIAELGYGTDGSTADDGWTWVSASADGVVDGNNDQVAAQLNIADAGTYSYSYRYSYDSSCWYYASEVGTVTVNALTTYDVTFSVNMSYAGDIDAENGVRIFGLASWSSDDAVSTTCDGGTCTATVSLTAGDYQYKYRNGWDYENVDNLSCASDTGYWNRDLTVSDSVTLDTVCFGACSDCAPGCTDSIATNYDAAANVDDGTCEYPAVDPENLFFSEYAEGSGNHKYLEIYNAEDHEVDLGGYSLSSCSNGCGGDGNAWQYVDNVSFDSGTMLASGDVYVVCHGSADDAIQAECDQTFTYLSNGDDAFGLTQVGSGTVLDVVGYLSVEDPGSGFDAAGVTNATKDHTLVRKAAVTAGNALWLDNLDADTGEVLNAGSAGSDADSSEWIVLDKDTWTFLGSHPHSSGCTDAAATNYDDSADINDGSCEYACDDVDEDDVCDDVDDCVGAFDECGTCNGSGPVEGYDCDGNLLVNVTFNVDMSEQTVDTEGYGLALFMPNPYGYYSMIDDDGDDVWSVTLTLVAETEYTYKYKNGDAWEPNFNDLGCGDGGSYGNRIFTTGGEDQSLDAVCFNSCSACVTCTNDGDVNGDTIYNVADIVTMVGWILNSQTQDAANLCSGDMDLDGTITVADIVALVNVIIADKASHSSISPATYADVILTKNNISVKSDGPISGLQMTLTHDSDFNFTIEDAFIAEYQTVDGRTTIVMVSDHSTLEQIGTYKGSCNVESILVVNEDSQIIDTDLVLDFDPVELELAGPNPFNPTTTLNVVVAKAGNVSVNVYNVLGQQVATLLNDYLEINTSGYTLNWNASNLPSGVYLVRAETPGSVSTQKLMLLK